MSFIQNSNFVISNIQFRSLYLGKFTDIIEINNSNWIYLMIHEWGTRQGVVLNQIEGGDRNKF